MIIIDNCPENFALQDQNGICISTWYDDVYDTALTDLSIPLLVIANKKPADVRKALSHFKEQYMEQQMKGITQTVYSLD